MQSNLAYELNIRHLAEEVQNSPGFKDNLVQAIYDTHSSRKRQNGRLRENSADVIRGPVRLHQDGEAS